MILPISAPPGAAPFVGPRAIAAIVLILLAACGTTTPVPPDGLRNPRGIALACIEGGAAKALATCASDKNVRAFITGGGVGSVSIARPLDNAWLDTDPSVPGFTPLMVGDLPRAIIGDPSEPKWLYMTLALGAELVRMDASAPALSTLTRTKLTFVPAGLATTTIPTARLYLADTEGGAIWRLELAEFATGGALTKIPVGGSPRAMVAVAGTGHLYVAHRDHAHVTVVSLADDTIVKRVSLGPACSDGLDNDNDGNTDGADSGCDSPDDRFEGDPEVGGNCSDGLDNDGDGQTDAADLGCAASATVDACRDGIDNDGDGKTDYPADPGCIGFGSTSETWDAGSCGDGIDNDGDGTVDTADSDCASADADTESPAVAAGTRTACNDGIDNDGDGKTDTDDADCPTATGDGEQRPACDDGIDNDGDGKTDLADDACTHRGSASEVAADVAPISSIAATFGGKWVVVTHRRKRAAFIIDTATQSVVHPGTGATFRRPSMLDARDGVDGVALGGQPLALAPITFSGRDAMAVTLQLGGLLVLSFDVVVPVDPPQKDATGKPVTKVEELIGLSPDPKGVSNVSKAQRPFLTVNDQVVDLGTKPPGRHANFGSLSEEKTATGSTRYFGLTPSDQVQEHRTEQWRVRAQGQIPGSERHTGRLVSATTLADPSADFCRLGVVAGDLLLLHRGPGAAECAGITGDTVRYRVVEVNPTSLKLATTGGVVDVAVTMDNQLKPPAPIAAPPPSPACFARRTIHYEIRADGWLVEGLRTGLLSSRGRVGATCAPFANDDLTQAARIVSATLKPDADVATMSCPLALADAALLQTTPYGGATVGALLPFKNLIWSGTLLPGCAPSDVPGGPPALLVPVRDTTWTYQITRGFSPDFASVGTNPVAIISGLGRGYVWVADQGAGTLYTVKLTPGLNNDVQTLD